MNFYEPFCQLCGVSFAIARLRRVDEPKQAAWDFTGVDFVEVYHPDANYIDMDVLCEEGSGCTVSDRGGDRPGEHLAGPGCVSHSGYSGHRISLAEMKGCRAVQCLVKKNANWMPEDDDQDFELEGDYFVSGIGDGSVDMTPLWDIEPVRHGVESIYVNNIVCFSSALPLLQSLANDGPHREPNLRTLFRSTPHASKYTKKYARCASVELTPKACSSVRVL